MKLRSSKALETGRLGVVLGIENTKAPSAKWISRRLGTSNSGINEAREAERFSLRSCKSNFGKKGANEDEIRVCIDNVDEDKGLFLGSEVLDPIKDLQVSFPDGEIKEESVERVHVEEGNKSSTSDIVNGDLSLLNDSKNGDGGADKIVHKRGPGRPRKKKRKIMAVSGGDMVVYGGESVTIKRKRGRKRKNIEDSECNENEKSRKKKVEVRVSERVLELKSKAVTGGGGMVVDGGRPEKKKKKKKLETRGRPRKKPIKTKSNEKVLELVCAAGTGGSAVVDGGTPEIKKVERRGRPRKIHGKTKTNKIPSMKKKKETRGRPRKIQVKETVPQKKKQLRDIIIKKLKIRKRIRNRKNRSKGKSVDKKDEEGKMGRGEYTKLVRKKVFDILVKAGWTFYRKPRLDRAYQDMVYVEPSGKCHWSITKAYTKLTKKVKDGYADNNEVNAFIQIPDDDMNMLFRPVYKNSDHKKKKKDGKGIKKVNPTKKIQKGKNGIKYIKKVNPKKKIQKGILVKSRKPRLLARGLETGTKKQEIKKRNLVSWMIDTGVILSGSKVKYGKTRKRVYEGVISSDGIVCGCCDKSMSLSEFVNHCGGKVNGGFDDVYLEGGVSLRKCLMDSWRKEEELNGIRYNLLDAEGDDPNDDTCNICGDGGNLICCDGCPSTFHQTCLDIQNFPAGEWNCIHCLCKFCGVVSDIAPEKPPSEMLSCGLCEEKFHQSCVIKVGAVDMNSNTPPFCGQKCQELFERLQTYIGVKNELENGFSWTLLQRCDISQDLSNLKVENNSKLAVAFSVMDECFLPIVDKRSGTSIIHNVVYNCGSNFRRLNYAGFLTAVLEKGEELVTAASIRLHGSRLAEMPFIGTRHTYRRQGMCRRLLDAIESTLSTIGVEELIIPAIPALLQTWTKVFGFTPLEESKKQEIKSINMLVFPGIDMLQKPLLHSNPDCIDSHENSVEHTANPNEINVSETTPKDTITDCDEIPADTSEITKNATEYEKVETTSSNAYAVEEDIMLMADSLCDLNFPVKNETFGPCSTESVTCGPDRFLESEVVVEDNAVKESSLTLKNNFDLNLDPNIVVGDGNEERCDSRDLVLV